MYKGKRSVDCRIYRAKTHDTDDSEKWRTHLACANEADEYDDHTFGTVLDGIEGTVHIVFVQARLG